MKSLKRNGIGIGGISLVSEKLYRVRRNQIKIVHGAKDKKCNFQAFKEGYVFIKELGSKEVFMISSILTKNILKVEHVNVEIVEE